MSWKRIFEYIPVGLWLINASFHIKQIKSVTVIVKKETSRMLDLLAATDHDSITVCSKLYQSREMQPLEPMRQQMVDFESMSNDF